MTWLALIAGLTLAGVAATYWCDRLTARERHDLEALATARESIRAVWPRTTLIAGAFIPARSFVYFGPDGRAYPCRSGEGNRPEVVP